MSHSPDHSATASLNCPEKAGDVVSSDADDSISDSPPDESLVNRLFDSEPHHLPHSDYLRRCRDRSIDPTARQASINWIFKVHAHYRFRPVTAFLSVNYFDRFLSTHSLPLENGWPFQLLAVACLSLAAKMEEPLVPLLLDLQVFEPRYVFEPKTVQRMELCVMANLNWRLHSVTPFDFLDYFVSKLPFSGPKSDRLGPLLSSSSDLILGTVRVIDFLAFPPSTIAAAVILFAAGESVDSPEAFYEKANKEMVRSCHQLMEECLLDTCLYEAPSPVGVLEAAAAHVSLDSRSENPDSGFGSWSSLAEPENKRPRSSAPDVQQ